MYRSGVPAVVFRPSYILGPTDGLMTMLLKDLESGVVEVPGDGRYRMQPISVADAAEAALVAALDPAAAGGALGPSRDRPGRARADLVRPLRRAVRGRGARAWLPVPTSWCATSRWRRRTARRWSTAIAACSPTSWTACSRDEVAEAAPLEELLGRPLLGLDRAIVAALDGLSHPQ